MPSKRASGGREPIAISDTGDDGISRHLDDLQRLSPRNGSQRDAIPNADLLAESHQRMTEAGDLIKRWLLNTADGEIWDNWENLTSGQRECLGFAGSPRSIEAIVSKRHLEHERAMREYRRKHRKTMPYPSINRGAVDYLDRDVPSPGVMEGGY